MKTKFFDAMTVYQKGIGYLLRGSGVPQDAAVFRFADGSYAVGEWGDIEEEFGDETDDTYEGTVSEFISELESE